MSHSDTAAAMTEHGSDEGGKRGGGVAPAAETARAVVAKRFVNRGAYRQLSAEISTERVEMEQLVERADAAGEAWAERAAALLSRAETALARGALDEAWHHLHAVERFQIYGLEELTGRTDTGADGDGSSLSALEIRARSVREEALANLEGWRRRAVVGLLCDETEAPKASPTGEEVRAASEILHEHYEISHQRRGERQRQFNHLVMMAAGSGLALFALTLADWLFGRPGSDGGLLKAFLETPFGNETVAVSAPGFAVFVTVVGVMGASLFGMRSLRKRSLSTRVPQQINQVTVTGARGVIGAISALLFYFALQTDFVGGGAILAKGVVSPTAMVVVAFAAGYTERMAPNVVATVASLTESDGEANRQS